MKFTKHKTGKTSYIDSLVTLEEIFNLIKNGDPKNLDRLLEIRKLGKDSALYTDLKVTLPTVRFNFIFKEKVSNANIVGPTGYIYIDVDGADTLDNTNPLILASWKSLSNTGFGVLVKVTGLTVKNFPDTYNAISTELGLLSDVGARKASQMNILSYDPEIYINNDSITFTAVNKKVSSSVIQKEKREERLISVDDTFKEYDTIRFDNISDYFIGNDEGYIVFDEKETICMPFIPRRIESGKRNTTMFFVLSQYALLNPECGAKFLLACAGTINDHFVEKYSEEKINSIVGAVITKRENKTLQPYFNKERRIIFNPKIKLTKQQKQKIVGQEMGRIKTDKTQKDIYEIIEGWNFEKGIINQEKVSSILGKSKITVKRHWAIVKDLVKEMNADYKNGITSYEAEKVSPTPSIVEESFTYVYETKTEEEYSDTTFYLWNGQRVKIKTEWLPYWEKISTMKGLVRTLADNNSQMTFDYSLQDEIRQMQERAKIYG